MFIRFIEYKGTNRVQDTSRKGQNWQISLQKNQELRLVHLPNTKYLLSRSQSQLQKINKRALGFSPMKYIYKHKKKQPIKVAL